LLAFPHSNALLNLTTDASDKHVGAVLQQQVNGTWQPLGFFSKKLNPAQSRYSAYDRELLAIYMAIKHFQYMVEGREFFVYTDHKPLVTAMKSKNTRSPRQERHLDFISQFTSDIRYVKGAENLVADALSRPESETIEILSPDLEELVKEQEVDQELKLLISNEPNANSNFRLSRIHIPGTNFSLWCDTSTSKSRPYVPLSLRKRIFQTVHDISHPGIRSTRKKITDMYFWPKMNIFINDLSKNCLQCQKQKVHRHTKSSPEQIFYSSR